MPKAGKLLDGDPSSTENTVADTAPPAESVKKKSTSDWFTPLEETTEYVKAVLYGHEGTGKTTSAAFAANLGRTLFVNVEGGLKKVALRKQGVKTENLAVWPPAGTEVTAQSLEDLHQKLLEDLTDDPNSWFCVVVDSLTETHHVLREQATKKRVAKSRVEVDPDFVDRDDYGVMTNQLRKLVRKFRDLPCHVVFLCLEKDDEDAKEYRPALTPALCTDVLGYADLVGRLASPENDFRARFTKTDRVRAKDRFGVLPEVLNEPNFVRVLDYVNGVYDDQEDPLQTELEAKEAERKAKLEAERLEKEKRKATKTTARKAPAKKAAPAAAAEADK
ncbi:RecA-like exonuclease [Gordonia phage Ghobes]|uniref:RecA-like exonuclease n=1 Tax=Gordonia phage Ghobes TaxID=1887647 RepID=A0A1B3B055_9CAUD|nr:Sak4-like ssDNA annealing protein [Gordonia phage Ghobes]AOE44383.1 RecA-like exonuclease [Gordonia phage Ghobes]